MWNDIKIIIQFILTITLPWLVLLLIIANPQLTYFIIISAILLCVFSKIIFNIISKVISNIASDIKYNQYCKQKETKMGEEKYIEEKWLIDLITGNEINIGETKIQCKNDALILNERSFFIKEIQKIEFTSKIVEAFRTTMKPDFYHDENYSEFEGWTPSTTIENYMPETKKITVDEYEKKMESIKFEIEFSGTANDKDIYDLKEEYYISIILNNGVQKDFLIGKGFTKLENYSKEIRLLKEMVNQVKICTFKSEEERQNLLQWINNLKNGNPVQIGKATIQAKNNMLIINKNNIFFKEIKKIEFTEKVSSVWKNSLDGNAFSDGETSGLIENPNWGKTIQRERISLEQYENEAEFANEDDSIVYSYDFEKGYYILITLYQGLQENFLIGNSISNYEENEKLKENLKELINDLIVVLKII